VHGSCPTETVGNITSDCSSFRVLPMSFNMKIHLGDGLGGRSGSLRRIASGTTSSGLGYDLYQGAARTVIFGGSHGRKPVHLTGCSVLTGYDRALRGHPQGDELAAAGHVEGCRAFFTPRVTQKVRDKCRADASTLIPLPWLSFPVRHNCRGLQNSGAHRTDTSGPPHLLLCSRPQRSFREPPVPEGCRGPSKSRNPDCA